MELLSRLAKSRVAPDLYVVTPFVVVAQNLRRLILQTGALGPLVQDHEEWTRERRACRLQRLLHDDEFQVVPLRFAEAQVGVGEGTALAGD